MTTRLAGLCPSFSSCLPSNLSFPLSCQDERIQRAASIAIAITAALGTASVFHFSCTKVIAYSLTMTTAPFAILSLIAGSLALLLLKNMVLDSITERLWRSAEQDFSTLCGEAKKSMSKEENISEQKINEQQRAINVLSSKVRLGRLLSYGGKELFLPACMFIFGVRSFTTFPAALAIMTVGAFFHYMHSSAALPLSKEKSIFDTAHKFYVDHRSDSLLRPRELFRLCRWHLPLTQRKLLSDSIFEDGINLKEAIQNAFTPEDIRKHFWAFYVLINKYDAKNASTIIQSLFEVSLPKSTSTFTISEGFEELLSPKGTPKLLFNAPPKLVLSCIDFEILRIEILQDPSEDLKKYFDEKEIPENKENAIKRIPVLKKVLLDSDYTKEKYPQEKINPLLERISKLEEKIGSDVQKQ